MCSHLQTEVIITGQRELEFEIPIYTETEILSIRILPDLPEGAVANFTIVIADNIDITFHKVTVRQKGYTILFHISDSHSLHPGKYRVYIENIVGLGDCLVEFKRGKEYCCIF